MNPPILASLKAKSLDTSSRPFLFCLEKPGGRDEFEAFLGKRTADIHFVHDTFAAQLEELIKTRHPRGLASPGALREKVEEHLAGRRPDDAGTWVFYPWSGRLVHVLSEPEFVELRTARNKYKITGEEQRALSAKKVGVIGLSIGHAIALTMATERTFGEIRLADFDRLDLSNLNRIRTAVHHVQVPKVIIAAREIAELDPFLKVTCFEKGIDEENLDAFLHQGGKLDLLVEVCDSLDVKILARNRARGSGIPVVMDTSDRGMVDVERFDLEPQRPILHGLIEHLDTSRLKGLTNEEKIPFIFSMIGIESVSTRLKASMREVGQSIATWPQLASAVTLGGGVTTDVCRRILLDQFHASGRYYVDVETLIADGGAPEPRS
jgi:tRNA A37 threonylcarbamoyladenosine dehydratase